MVGSWRHTRENCTSVVAFLSVWQSDLFLSKVEIHVGAPLCVDSEGEPKLIIRRMIYKKLQHAMQSSLSVDCETELRCFH